MPYISGCWTKLKSDLNWRNTVDLKCCCFFLHSIAPTEFWVGQRRFWKDDASQTEEYQHFHSVREECHLEDGNNYVHKQWTVGKTTSQTFFASHASFNNTKIYKCRWQQLQWNVFVEDFYFLQKIVAKLKATCQFPAMRSNTDAWCKSTIQWSHAATSE